MIRPTATSLGWTAVTVPVLADQLACCFLLCCKEQTHSSQRAAKQRKPSLIPKEQEGLWSLLRLSCWNSQKFVTLTVGSNKQPICLQEWKLCQTAA